MFEDLFYQRLIKLRTEKGVSARDMSLSIGQSPGYIDYSGPLAHPGRSLAQLDRASAHSTRSAVQPMLAADQHTC